MARRSVRVAIVHPAGNARAPTVHRDPAARPASTTSRQRAARLLCPIASLLEDVFAHHKLPIRDYLAAIAIFCNEVKGKSSLALSRDLGVQFLFVLPLRCLRTGQDRLRAGTQDPRGNGHGKEGGTHRRRLFRRACPAGEQEGRSQGPPPGLRTAMISVNAWC